jgi:hypothetical protein
MSLEKWWGYYEQGDAEKKWDEKELHSVQQDLNSLKESLKNITEIPMNMQNITEHIELVEKVMEGNTTLLKDGEIIANSFKKDGIEGVIHNVISFANKLLKWLGMKPFWADKDNEIHMMHNELRPLKLPWMSEITQRTQEQKQEHLLYVDSVSSELEQKQWEAATIGKMFTKHAFMRYITDIKNHRNLIEFVTNQPQEKIASKENLKENLKENQYEVFLEPHIEPWDIVLLNYKPSAKQTQMSMGINLVNKMLQDGSQSPYIHVWMIGGKKKNASGETVNTFYHSSLSTKNWVPWVEKHPDFKEYIAEKNQKWPVQMLVIKPININKRDALLTKADEFIGARFDTKAATWSILPSSISWLTWQKQDQTKYNCGEYVAAIIQWVYGITIDEKVAPLPWTFDWRSWWVLENNFIATAVLQYPPRLETI